MTMLIVGTSSSLASAQAPSPCTATLNYPVQYGYTSAPFVVPVSASCETYYGSQLYATGSAYDATSNTGLGTANTVLSSVNGGTQFSGQLGFNLPPTSSSDSVQISVSIYDNQGGNLLAMTSETLQPTGVQQVQQVTTVTSTVTQGQYPYADPTPLTYQPNQFQSQPQNHRSPQTHYVSQSFSQRGNNTNLLDYAVIIAIIASVIIATAGLVLLARRQQAPQPVWYPVPPPR
jgi:hypothetical protein